MAAKRKKEKKNPERRSNVRHLSILIEETKHKDNKLVLKIKTPSQRASTGKVYRSPKN